MPDAYGPCRFKWVLEWPVTIPRSPLVNDDLPVSIPNVKIEFVVLGGAIEFGLAVVTFFSKFEF